MAGKTKPNVSTKLSESTRLKLKPLDGILLGIALILVVAGIWGSLRKDSGPVCTAPGMQHEIVIKEESFSASRLELNQCDTVQIANLGTETYELAFGTRDKHIEYPGFSIQALRPNEYFVLDAVQAGSYRLHDHLRDKAVIFLDIRAKQ